MGLGFDGWFLRVGTVASRDSKSITLNHQICLPTTTYNVAYILNHKCCY
jgi:hypothetical protein